MNTKIKTLIQALVDEINETKGAKDAQTSTNKWWSLLDWKTPEYRTMFDSLGEETRNLIIEAGLCPTCADAARSEEERAMSHFNITEEEWEKLSDEEKQKYIEKLPERGEGKEDDNSEETVETDTTPEPEKTPETPPAAKEKPKLDAAEVLKRANRLLNPQ